MSRSKPQEESSPNPSKRWFEWNGETGAVRYYDKAKKENIEVKLPFRFLMLDQLARISGWSDSRNCGITSNEVRDSMKDMLHVRAYKGGAIATGTWDKIKAVVHEAGGHFEANVYIAFKDEQGALQIGAIGFKGAALNSWINFRNANRAALYEKAVSISGSVQGKKGKIVFHTPVFGLSETNAATNELATKLDVELQAYLSGYLTRTTKDQTETTASATNRAATHTEPEAPEGVQADADHEAAQPDGDDVPF